MTQPQMTDDWAGAAWLDVAQLLAEAIEEQTPAVRDFLVQAIRTHGLLTFTVLEDGRVAVAVPGCPPFCALDLTFYQVDERQTH